MRATATGAIAHWPLHLARLRRGCAAVGFPLDQDKVERALARLSVTDVSRVRLAIDASGMVDVTCEPLPQNPAAWTVVISNHILCSCDPWLRIKTSHRPIYTAARAALPDGAHEAILMNERGELCEGTITSLFLLRDGKPGDAKLLTPPLDCGVLPGVMRQVLLNSGVATEAVLYPDDLKTGKVIMGNALRGLIGAVVQDPF
ncbi:aminotransferase class IV [Paracoccus amoyensis]|nr:aminotransferase class IV [Paracoccus amoyensis]